MAEIDGDVDPQIFSWASGLQIARAVHDAVLAQFAMRPLVLESCTQLDEAKAQALELFAQSPAFRYSSSLVLCTFFCYFCGCLICLLGYLNMRGEHARLQEQVSNENRQRGLPEDYDFDEDRTRLQQDSALSGSRISPYDDDDLQHH